MTNSIDTASLVALTARMDALDASVAALGAQNRDILAALAVLTAASGPRKAEFVAKRG